MRVPRRRAAWWPAIGVGQHTLLLHYELFWAFGLQHFLSRLLDQFASNLVYRDNFCFLARVRATRSATVGIVFKASLWFNFVNNRVVTRCGVDGTQTCSFCYVDDLIDGLVRLMATADPVVGPVNIGNPNEFSMRELASVIIDLTGSRSRIVHRPLPEDDPRKRQPDISLAQELLAWAPKTQLKEGLARTVAYFEKLLAEKGEKELLLGGTPA